MSPYEAWATTAAWLTAVGTVGLLIAAIAGGKIALRTLRQMERDSQAQTRPYLYASLAPSLAGGSIYDLVIENTGASTARSVRVLCPEFPSKPDDIAKKLGVFLNLEHTIPPKVRLRNYWRLELAEGHTWEGGGTSPVGMPGQAAITLNYSDDFGHDYIDTFHVDKRTIDFAPTPRKGPKVSSDVSTDQKDTHKMLAVIAEAIGEIRR